MHRGGKIALFVCKTCVCVACACASCVFRLHSPCLLSIFPDMVSPGARGFTSTEEANKQQITPLFVNAPFTRISFHPLWSYSLFKRISPPPVACWRAQRCSQSHTLSVSVQQCNTYIHTRQAREPRFKGVDSFT